MKTETPCPVCKKPVSMGTIMGASTPSRIKCKHCKTRLGPNPGATPILVGILGAAGFIGFILGFGLTYEYLDGNIAMFDVIMIMMIVVLPLVIIAEVMFSLIVVNKSGLVVYR